MSLQLNGGATRLVILLSVLLGGCEADEKVATDLEGSGEGSGANTTPCWVESLSGICPDQPRGSRAEDCPSGALLEGSGFAAGTGICRPHLPDWTCPDGWLPVPALTDGSGAESPPDGVPQFTRCEPPPLPADCPAGTFALPGEATCQPLGLDCPAATDRWPDEASLRSLAPGLTGPIVYVSADAAADGAGTRDNPRPLSAAAVRAAETGIVALALGDYTGSVRLDRRVALLGACVTGTRLTSDTASDSAGVVDIAAGAPVIVSNLTISGERPGIWIRGTLPQPHLLTDLEIRDTRQHGLLATTPQQFELRRIRIAGVRPRASDGALGRGLELIGGAMAEVDGLDLSGAEMVGLLLSDAGTAMTAHRLYLHDIRLTDRSPGGSALAVVSRASMTLDATVMERSFGSGIYVDDAILDASDLIVSDTLPLTADETYGIGISVSTAATFTLRQGLVRRSHRAGLAASGNSNTTLSSVIVEDTAPQPSDADFGAGISILTGAIVTGSSVVLRRNHQGAARSEIRGTLLELEDVLIEETRPTRFDLRLGLGLEAFSGGTATLRRAYLRANHEAAILALGPGSSVTVTDSLIADTRAPSEVTRIGTGLGVRDGASMRAERLRIRGNLVAGIYVREALSSFVGNDIVVSGGPPAPDTVGILSSDGAAVELTRVSVEDVDNLAVLATGESTQLSAASLLVRNTAADPASGLNGRALEATGGARIALQQTLMQNNRDIALLAIDLGTEVTGEDLAIEGTRARPSPRDDFGTAMGIYDEARFTGRNLSLMNNAQCGLQLAGDGASFDIDGARIAGNRVGLSVQQDGAGPDFVRTHLRNDTFESNGEDVAFESLPIPDPSGALP